jgi:hypothetical protein
MLNERSKGPWKLDQDRASACLSSQVGWDRPPEAMMEEFFRTHPECNHTAPLPSGFHWK